ncbi:MAG: helix-turn-helix domain-containing protein [Candidatus Omnitrophica bacterium]|nr:helix-turn-helix domain-containing protein [Candidatus Omnitrophota bacterium]
MAKDQLLTSSEVAKLLNISEEKIEVLVDSGEIPYYKIGGTFLRFKESHIEEIRLVLETSLKRNSDERSFPSEIKFGQEPSGREQPPAGEIKHQHISTSVSEKMSLFDRLIDFWHFYDFYILALIVAGIIIYVIFKTIR